MNRITVGTDSGGREAIHRIVEAYGFKSRQQLCLHLDVSKSTMANRYMRDSFPAEWVIQCALETGASLLWLSTGQGEPFSNSERPSSFKAHSLAPALDKYLLADGSLVSEGKFIIDSSLLPQNTNNLIYLSNNHKSYIIDKDINEIKDGVWLVKIEGLFSLRKINRIPVNKIRVSDENISFDCSLDEIELIGRANITLNKN
ncbi:phage repressor protein CI [Cronobacter sakazakii]|uniref:Phage repressor protein n=1 Tax=Mixta calida TaxID=665913 RepID=A0ABM6S3N4_9GAMM|nr:MULTISPECIES: phage repressor protein CI [Enterobacterales]AUY26283.1 phage repressor protein [Mixta calida]EGT4441766.1 phage repressor protein [Cronobacter sakazakii]ELY5781017.1 phage repressor protein CI [Cronobacter sakazakii]ORM56196.1 phage repressor protein [Mixta calida]UNM57391.1 helix-turn-helix domain-containing protein [Cronobacter sakazakii]